MKKCPEFPRCSCIVQGYVNPAEPSCCGRAPKPHTARKARTPPSRAQQRMHYGQAKGIIWMPDHHPLATVVEAAEFVLATFEAPSADVHQASHLITTIRPR